MKITPDNIIYNYAYNDNGNLTTIITPQGDFTFTYDAANRRVTRTAPNGTISTYSYDTINRLTGIQTTKDAATIDYVNYTQFDNVGNRLTRNTPQENWAFTYDDIYRLTNASPTGTIHQPEDYTYDHENRLTGVTITQGSNSKQLTFAYDPFGRRIRKTVSPSGGGSGEETTNYVYDGQSIVMEYDQNNNITAKYIHGPSIDEPLAVQQGTNTYYYHADGLGSITSLSNASGSPVQTYTYDSFGNITASDSISQPYAYTGREYDSETGMYFYRARYYDPKVGRFVTKDPIGFAGGDYNLYNYVGANPVNWIDPSGFYWFRQFWQEPGVVGRQDTIVPPNGLISEFIEKYVPAGYTFGETHDNYVDAATNLGWPDKVINIPSMIPIYVEAVGKEILRTAGIISQPTPPSQPNSSRQPSSCK